MHNKGDSERIMTKQHMIFLILIIFSIGCFKKLPSEISEPEALVCLCVCETICEGDDFENPFDDQNPFDPQHPYDIFPQDIENRHEKRAGG